MFESRLLGSAVAIAVLGGVSMSLSAQQAQFAQGMLSTQWLGNASCTVVTNGPYAYHDEQTHTWLITLDPPTQSGVTVLNTDAWSDTGGGMKNGEHWITNGHASGKIGFYTDAQTMLHIGLASSMLRDNVGITVTDSSRTYAGPAYEWPFPNITAGPLSAITARNGDIDVVSPGPVAVPVTGSVGWQEPGGSTSNASCSWRFHYGPLKLPPVIAHPWPPIH